MSLDYEFANRIIEYYNFPKTTKFDLHFVQEKIKDNSKLEKKYTKIVNKYIIDESINIKKARKKLNRLANKYEIDEYLLDLVYVINCMPIVYDKYVKRCIDKKIFWDSFRDMEYKNAECINVYGKSGTFVFDGEKIVK